MKTHTLLKAVCIFLAAAALAGCATPNPSAPGAAAPADAAKPVATAPAPAAAPAPPPIMPFEEALSFAANNLFSKAALPEAGPAAGRFPLVIDPLVDGVTGVQSTATQKMEAKIGELVRSQYPKYDLQPFTSNMLTRGPLLFIGTFTPVDKEAQGTTSPKWTGEMDWYRVCLALVDLRSGKIVSKGFARAKPDGIDHTPTAFFQDSPAWAPDTATEGYVKTCQGTKVGDPINPAYWDRILAAAMINDALTAYSANRYDEALDLYRGALRGAGGDQLRVHNGIYLSAWKLGRKDEAAQAFGRIVDYGLAQNRLAVKLLFRPGSTLFVNDPQVSAPYPIWLKQIAAGAAKRNDCIEVAGHTSRSGPAALNERLSLLRAEFVKRRIDSDAPPLARRTKAVGKGFKENLSGLGTDDARDALDRRVEFKTTACGA